MAKLGFADRKITEVPQNAQDLMGLLSKIMVAAVNNEVELENAKVALNAATRIVEVWQADTRMKALAIASKKAINNTGSWPTLDTDSDVKMIEVDAKEKK